MLDNGVIGVTGPRSRLVHKPQPVDAPTPGCPDITLARNTFAWEPRIELRECTAFWERCP